MLLQATPLYNCTSLIRLKPWKGTWCWAQCWIGWRHRKRFEGTSGRRHLQRRRPADLRELAEFHYSSRALIPALNTQSWDQNLPLFVVSRAHHVATLNGCHRDVGHQGHDHTLSILQEHFWWPGMANQMQQSIKSCVHCLQHVGNLSKVPLNPIVATTPMDLLHVDFTSIETTLELSRLPKVANVLVFQDLFSKHVLAYMIPYQTAKAVTKFLYQGYISIFGTFISSSINKICKLLGVRKLQTTPYQPQMKGMVERSHQTIIWMIRKLGEDKKANWPGHLAEIVHTYNATWSTMMGYSPHISNVWMQAKAPSQLLLPHL